MTLVDRTHIHALQAFSPSHGDGQHLAIPGSCSVCAERYLQGGPGQRAVRSHGTDSKRGPHGMRTWISAPIAYMSRTPAQLSGAHTQRPVLTQ